MTSKFTLLMYAAEKIEQDILNGNPPPLRSGIVFDCGKPCCIGGWILWQAGYRPGPFRYARVSHLLDEFLEDWPPMWLLHPWHDMEMANDDQELAPDKKLRWICMTLKGLIKAIQINTKD